MLQRRDRRAELADAWLRATGLTVIVALGKRSGDAPIMPFFGDPHGVARIIERQIADSENAESLVLERWFLNASLAGRVHERAFRAVAKSTIDGAGWFDVSASKAAILVEEAAVAIGAMPRLAQDVEAQAFAAADAVIIRSEEMRVSGELAVLNAAYKQYRASFKSTDEYPKADDYQDWMHRVRLRTASDAGAKIGQKLRLSIG